MTTLAFFLAISKKLEIPTQEEAAIDNQAVIKKALAERRQALSRPVYPDIPERGLYTGYDTASRGKENNTGGIIERNPYPYESRAI